MIKVFTLIIVFSNSGLTSQKLQYPTLESCNYIKNYYKNQDYVLSSTCTVEFK